MTQMPPLPANPGMPGYPPQRQTNGMAVASLVCGLLGCIPAITSLLAILFGFLGMSKAKDPRVGGKGMAIAGLLLGIAGLIGWAGAGFAIYKTVGIVQRMSQPAIAFVDALLNGDAEKARSMATADMSDADIEAAIDKLKTMGELKEIKPTGVNRSSINGLGRLTVTGTALFARGTLEFSVQMVEDKGVWKVGSFELK